MDLAHKFGMADLLPYRDDILRIANARLATNVRVFGSFARDEATDASDVDLLVDTGDFFSLLDHIVLERELGDLLHRKVDLGTPEELHPVIRDQVLKEARPL